MNSTLSDKPPANANDGDLWYNTVDNDFYVFDSGIWEVIPNHLAVVNMVLNNTTEEDKEDPVKAYDRAMGVI